MSTPAERAALIEKIRRLPGQVEALIADLTPEQLAGHFLPNEWSVAQNVHHLADSHMNSYIRCKLIATEEEPVLKPYDQDRWAVMPDATGVALAPSLELLRALHTRWVHFWESLEPAEWERSGMHPESGILTLAMILHIYADHGEAHIDQMTRTLKAQYAQLPANRQELMAWIDREWTSLQQLVSRLGTQRLAMADANGWTAKDHLAHIATWERSMVRRILSGVPYFAALEIEDADEDRLTIDEANAILFQRHQTEAATAVVASLEAAHQETMDMLSSLPWERLEAPLAAHLVYREEKEPRPGLWLVAANTYDHYLEHNLWLRTQLL
ncbi:MAG: DinB family protein [Caldilineaceae bacterium]|nr:DinB family protein [Caldilineaceae bacterium]